MVFSTAHPLRAGEIHFMRVMKPLFAAHNARSFFGHLAALTVFAILDRKRQFSN